MTFRSTTTALALTTALTTPALADVSPADVLSNQQALFTAVGATLSGNLNGDQLNNPQLNVILPEDWGGLQVTGEALTMTENGDGTVTISYPSPMNITIAGGLKDAGSFSVDLVMTHDGYTVVASGEAGDVAYASTAQNVVFVMENLMLDTPGAEDVTGEGTVIIESWTANSRVTEGNLITYTNEVNTGETSTNMSFGDGDVQSSTSQTTLPQQSVISAMFPVGGSNLMNLSEATRNGLSIEVASTGEGSSSSELTMMGGDLFNDQTTTIGAQVANLRFDEAGFVVDGTAQDLGVTVMQPMMMGPIPISFGAETLAATYDVPFNASDDAQDFRLSTSLSGVTLGNELWSMFDPSAQLPRDPADVSFDITGNGVLGMDLLDIAAMADLMGPPPVTVDDVTIENLRIAAVGAEATAEGAMTFDWTDMETIPGMPRPQGAVTVNVNGANALMDRLVAMGLIPEEELMMPRMMMGMFATPVGNDMLQSVLEINEQGHVLANGQRLQ